MWKIRLKSANKAFLSFVLIVVGLSSPAQNANAQSQLTMWQCGSAYGASEQSACQIILDSTCVTTVMNPMYMDNVPTTNTCHGPFFFHCPGIGWLEKTVLCEEGFLHPNVVQMSTSIEGMCPPSTDGLLEYDLVNRSDNGQAICECSSGDESFPSDGPAEDPKGCKGPPDKNDGDGCGVGNPCNPATGNKFQSETDFASNGLSFTRLYNSRHQIDDIGLGRGWRSNYHQSLLVWPRLLTHVSDTGRGESWLRSVLLENGNFEANGAQDGFRLRASYWAPRFGGSSGGFNPRVSAYPAGIPDGNNIGYAKEGNALVQKLDTEFSASVTYTLTLELGTRADVPGIANYAVSLFASDVVTGGLELGTATGSTSTNGTFETATLVIESGTFPPDFEGVGQKMRVEIRNTGGVELGFDIVSLVTTPSSPTLIGDADSDVLITEDASGFQLTRANGAVENYDLNGVILSETDTNGFQTDYSYDVDDQLAQVTNSYGQSIMFVYTDGHITMVTDSFGANYVYEYDANDNLTAVVLPDLTPGDNSDNPRTIYHYEDPAFPNHLTGITDANGDRFATFSYDVDGNAITTEHAQTTNAAGQERFELEYQESP